MMTWINTYDLNEINAHGVVQGFDASRNKVEKGRKVCVILEGAEFQDDCGDDRTVSSDDCPYILCDR